ncbi:MAG: hypothetical protein ACR2PR_09115 [Pseudohongiellaceae bacterium]
MDYSEFIAQEARKTQAFFYSQLGMTWKHIARIDPGGAEELWMWKNPRASAFFFLWLLKIQTILTFNNKGQEPSGEQIINAAIAFLNQNGDSTTSNLPDDALPPHMTHATPPPVATAPPPVAAAAPQPNPTPTNTTAAKPKVGIADIMAKNRRGGGVKHKGLPAFDPEGKDKRADYETPHQEGAGGIDNRTGETIP